MFAIFQYVQGTLICLAVAFLIFALSQSIKTNRFIDDFNEQNSKDDIRKYRNLPHAPIVEIILCLVLLVMSLFFPLSKK